jgi:uncharacterized membrane protein YidH (DUF202 family)
MTQYGVFDINNNDEIVILELVSEKSTTLAIILCTVGGIFLLALGAITFILVKKKMNKAVVK